MAKYTPDTAGPAIRTNGPNNAVRSTNYPNEVFTRTGTGRKWANSRGKEYDNFAAILGEWLYLEDVTDAYEEAINYFTERNYRDLNNADLTSSTAKRHALAIIQKAIPQKDKDRPKTLYNTW